MLKDIFKKNNFEDTIGFNLRGKLEIIGERNGKIVHHDEGNNVVTVWAKHASMHLFSSESYSSHGNMDNLGTIQYSGRGIGVGDHTVSDNIDGTLISGGQYFADNTDFYSAGFKYLNIPNNMSIDTVNGDQLSFNYPFFPTKMLFGTGIEYKSWSDIPEIYKGSSSDVNSYANANNGLWDSSSFDSAISNASNYYSNKYNPATYDLFKTRTVNDISSSALSETPIETHTGISGAIKDGTYDNSSEEGTKISTINGKKFLAGSYRGIGRPSFIYARRDRFFNSGSEIRLTTGTVGTPAEYQENRITYTVVMPEQTNGEFYPYNGYALKTAGLFCDARMVINNLIPTVDGRADHVQYQSMPCGIMWAKRNISTIYKTHDLRITAKWTIYLP